LAHKDRSNKKRVVDEAEKDVYYEIILSKQQYLELNILAYRIWQNGGYAAVNLNDLEEFLRGGYRLTLEKINNYIVLRIKGGPEADSAVMDVREAA
jgi:hypothetical protein